MLYAVKTLGAKKIAFPESAHKSVWNGCAALGLEALTLSVETEGKIPLPATRYALNEENIELCKQADALLVTSPDYYGNVCDLQQLRDFCDREKKWLLIDGAHGGHLHFNQSLYAGNVADVWVDGVHKSLPAFTQGAVVSARTDILAAALLEGVDVFRTTSPSYPIMASVEYAVKFSRNEALENAVKSFQKTWSVSGRVYENEDWTKLCAVFGDAAFDVDKSLQAEGIYSEFCDGNIVTFYLSPATKMRDFQILKKRLEKLFIAYPLPPFEKKTECLGKAERLKKHANGRVEWIEMGLSTGRVCAKNCGLFPPCSPIILQGERITAEKIELLTRADNVYGLKEKRICVYVEETTEGEGL